MTDRSDLNGDGLTSRRPLWLLDGNADLETELAIRRARLEGLDRLTEEDDE
jgi:hypothetical protein